MLECVSFMTLNTIISLILFAASILIPLSQVIFSEKQYSMRSIIELFIPYALFFNVGCLFMAGGTGQLLYGLELSSCLGWSWSFFQYELAFSEFGLALLGFMSPLFGKEFWIATSLAAIVWLSGAAGAHIYSFMQGNTAITHALFAIVWNIFLAVWLLVLTTLLVLSSTKKYS